MMREHLLSLCRQLVLDLVDSLGHAILVRHDDLVLLLHKIICLRVLLLDSVYQPLWTTKL